MGFIVYVAVWVFLAITVSPARDLLSMRLLGGVSIPSVPSGPRHLESGCYDGTSMNALTVFGLPRSSAAYGQGAKGWISCAAGS
jgi:hypothetical protein